MVCITNSMILNTTFFCESPGRIERMLELTIYTIPVILCAHMHRTHLNRLEIGSNQSSIYNKSLKVIFNSPRTIQMVIFIFNVFKLYSLLLFTLAVFLFKYLVTLVGSFTKLTKRIFRSPRKEGVVFTHHILLVSTSIIPTTYSIATRIQPFCK